jgi:hypothetical protein
LERTKSIKKHTIERERVMEREKEDRNPETEHE